MGEAQLTRCVSPTISARNWSTYTVLGFVGYFVASAVGAVLALHWNLALGERLVALIAPPSAFVVAITLATAIKGREWIVFYQALFAAVGVVVVAALLTHGRLWRELDVTVIGIGTFLVFGRIGCFQVACCHGRPSRRGVVYGAAHVTAGFWPRQAARTRPVAGVRDRRWARTWSRARPGCGTGGGTVDQGVHAAPHHHR
jgi:hypothetical protein